DVGGGARRQAVQGAEHALTGAGVEAGAVEVEHFTGVEGDAAGQLERAGVAGGWINGGDAEAALDDFGRRDRGARRRRGAEERLLLAGEARLVEDDHEDVGRVAARVRVLRDGGDAGQRRGQLVERAGRGGGATGVVRGKAGGAVGVGKRVAADA